MVPSRRALFELCASLVLVLLTLCLSGCDEHSIDMTLQCADDSTSSQMCKSWKQTGTATKDGGEKFALSINYACLDGSTNAEYCKTWRQSGTLKKEGGSCLPGDALVVTREGPVPMFTVRLGDELLGFDHVAGLARFTRVRAWLHKDANAESFMTALDTDAGRLLLSPKHSVAVQGGDRYSFAMDVRPGDELACANGTRVRVRGVAQQAARGFYSPLTGTSNYFAGQDTPLLVHSFAHLPFPRRFEGAVHAMVGAWDLVFGSEPQGDSYVHPLLRVFAPLAGVDLRERTTTLSVQNDIKDGRLLAATPHQNNNNNNQNNENEKTTELMLQLSTQLPLNLLSQ